MSTTREDRLPRFLLVVGLVAGLAVAVAVAVLVPGWRNLPGTTCAVRPPRPFFADETAPSGVNFTHHNGEEVGFCTVLESLGGGVALIDYDGDGLLDLFLSGGGYFTGQHDGGIKGYPCALYRNLGNFRFRDVTAEAGLEREWFCTHGAAVIDFDRDGWPDLLVTGWRRMALFRNEPVDPRDGSKGRKFVEVTKEAKLPEGLWTTSAAWGDLDGDGFPDLYLCQYVDWSFAKDKPFVPRFVGQVRDVPPPKQFDGLPHKLYRNNGNGAFTDVSKEAGLRGPREPADYTELVKAGLPRDAVETLRRGDAEGDSTRYGKGLGVLMVDVNGDGKPDVYVANDTVDNFLYVNRTEIRRRILLEEKGMESGTARDGDGNPDGSKGLDAGDPFGQGRPSLWVTNYENELHCLYRNNVTLGQRSLFFRTADKEYFLFSTRSSGLAANGQDTVGWGTGFLDLDHDGWEDLFFTDGHAIRHPPKIPRAQRPGLFRNTGGGKFVDFRDRGGPYFQEQHIGRGAVLGDLDNDGKIDLVISHLNEPVTLLHNVADTAGNPWLGVELAGKDHRDVTGSRVVIESGGRRQARFAKGGGSYLSSGDRRLVFGLGNDGGKDLKLTVSWSWGKKQEFKIPAVDRYWRLVEGDDVPHEVRSGP